MKRSYLTPGAIVLFACVLAGCAGTTTLAAVETGLTGAEKAATAYIQLPLCPSTNGTLCSDAATSARIKQADDAAYAAVKLAEQGGSVSAAQAAVAALVAIIPTK